MLLNNIGMIPGKECPEDCFCRWYPKNADIID
jgi:hypothetical protein